MLEPLLAGNEKAYVMECLDTGWVSSQGQFVERFESDFSALHCGLPSVSTSNGTAALHLALLALGVQKGDEVIIPDLTFAATINAVLYCGAIPVLVDVDSHSWNIAVESIEQSITSRTKAIISVHLYGQPCDMSRLQLLADKHNLLLIEDSAEALGSTYQGYPIGTFGDASIFSFFGNKTITTGEGGMVVFQDDQVAGEARVLRDHGMKPGKQYWHEVLGYNYRLTNVQAAIGIAQLEKLTRLVKAKQIIASRYECAFEGLNIQMQGKLIDSTSSYWLCSFLLNDKAERDSIISYLERSGVETRPFFYPLHMQPPYSKLHRSGSLKSTEVLAERGISLPSSAGLSVIDQDYVIERVINGLNEMREIE